MIKLPPTLRTQLLVAAIGLATNTAHAATEAAQGSSSEAPPESAKKEEDVPPPAIRNPPLRLATRRDQSLAKIIEAAKGTKGEVLWQEDGKDKYLMLYLEQFAKEKKGALLILHDNEQGPDWPGMVHRLRLDTPEHGWSTLSVSLPDYMPIPAMLPALPRPALPPADTAGKEDKAGENDKKATNESKDEKQEKGDKKSPPAEKTEEKKEESKPAPPPPPEFLQKQSEVKPDEYAAVVKARVAQGIKQLKSKGVDNIVLVASGMNATVAAVMATTPGFGDISGLIMLEAREFDQSGHDLPSLIPKIKVPVLDLVPDSKQSLNSQKRRQASARSENQRYQQRLVSDTGEGFANQESQVEKIIRTWATQNHPKRGLPSFGHAATEKQAPKESGTTTENSSESATNPQDKATGNSSGKTATGILPQTIPPPAPKPGTTTPNLKEAIPPPIPG